MNKVNNPENLAFHPIISSQEESYPLKGRVLKAPLSWGQTLQRFGVIVMVALVSLVGTLLTLGIPLLCRAISDETKEEIKLQVVDRQIQHLSQCKLGVNEDQIIQAAKDQGLDGKSFAKNVIWLDTTIQAYAEKKKKIHVGSVEKLYQQFQKFAEDATFIEVFNALEEKDHPAAKFLKDLSVKFRSTPMSDLLVEYVKKKYPMRDQEFSISQTADLLKKHQKKRGFQRSLFWAIAHPEAWLHSMESHLFPHAYDSLKMNPTYCAYKMEYLGKPIQFIAGPTPFNDPVYEHIFSKVKTELRFNVMDLHKKNERKWIEKTSTMTDQVVMGFSKKGFLSSSTLDELIDQYKQALLQEEDKVLTDEKIEQACKLIKELFQGCPLNKKEVKHAILVALDAMIAVGIIDKKAKEQREGPLQIAIACKQFYDRGPVYFEAILYFLKVLSSNSTTLDEKTFYTIAGLPMFRAPIYENRRQIEGKFKVFEQFAQIIPNDKLLQCLRKFIPFIQNNV